MTTAAVLVGAAAELIELCALCDVAIAGIFDPRGTGTVLGCPILGDDAAAAHADAALKRIPVIVAPDRPARRRQLAAHYRQLGFTLRSLISPLATISRSATIGHGAVIQSHCNVSAAATLGELVRLNTGANVMHEAQVGAYTTIAPNAVVLGRVAIGADCYVGANSTILPDLTVGSRATVGAGAVVTKPVAEGATVAGPAARVLATR